MSLKSLYIIGAIVFGIMALVTWGERSKRTWSYAFGFLAVASGFIAFNKHQQESNAGPDPSIDLPSNGN